MNPTIPEDSLIVVHDIIKEKFIKEYRKENGLKNNSIMGLNEFKKKFYFDYSNATVFYICKRCSCIPEIAKMYLENMYYIDEICTEEKVVFLRDLKKELKENDLLIENTYFRKSLEHSTIVLYDLKRCDEFYNNMFKSISHVNLIEIDSNKELKTPKPLYRFIDSSHELEFVATKIAELIKRGVPLNNIKIANVKDDYQNKLARIMQDFNIPLEISNKETIKSTNILSSFKAFLSDTKEGLIENLKSLIHSQRDERIVKSMVDIVNSYNWAQDLNEVYPLLIHDIENIPLPSTKYKNAIRCVDFLDTLFDDEDYIFLINFNQGSFPKIEKDEGYLNDATKKLLGMSDSIDLNRKTYDYAQNKICSTKNLIVTYSKKSLKGELYISPVYDENILTESFSSREFIHSDSHNLKELVKERDENRKYGTITDTLSLLASHYKDEPYMCYDNKYKTIPKEKLMHHLNNKLTLSYSSMNTYYLCSFRYYLDNILKLDEFDKTFDTEIGNIFHRVLSFAFNENFDFESSWNKALEETDLEFSTKDKFFLKVLKEELKFIISSIEKGMEYTDLKNALYEQKIIVDIDENTTFKGFVDKILYGEFEGSQIATIIDYKTGNPELKLDNVIYGIDMQLPIYAYLIGKYEPLKDAKLGGFYLQKILSNAKSTDDKLEALKLQGYSNDDPNILRHVDKNYENSKIIKSLKTGNNGFYSYAKILSGEKISKLTGLVEKKIIEASNNIKEGKFDINPKEIGMNLYGCKFCKFADICYKSASDTKKLKSKSAKDFLGGDNNADMD